MTMRGSEKKTRPLPVRRKIQIGKVALLRGKFDRLAEKEERDIDLKRFRKSCPKPLTPGSARRGKKSGRGSTKVMFDKKSTFYKRLLPWR